MKHVKKSLLLWYSAREMYDLVIGCDAYPAFLPWCERSEFVEQHEAGATVRLHLHYAGLRHAFTTRNAHVPEQSVTMALIDGPFSELDGTWLFKPIGDDPALRACRIEFDLRYAFSNRALESVLSPVFDRVANTFVESFVQRAEQVYGAR
jgi:ribosome-associated toxin RatA of RatAB toxin-antitoxin module